MAKNRQKGRQKTRPPHAVGTVGRTHLGTLGVNGQDAIASMGRTHFLCALFLVIVGNSGGVVFVQRVRATGPTYPEVPAILFLRSDLTFRSDLIFVLAGKCENKIRSKK